jgi:hypothetical protein
MPANRVLVPVLCLMSFLFTPASFAEVECGNSILSLDDLKTLARERATADRVAPHTAMRSAFARLGDQTALRAQSARLGAAAANEKTWQPGFGLPGLHEYAGAAIEYQGELVVAGWLRSAGTHPVNGIARWTNQGWQPLGEGIIPGFALAIWNGRLYAGDWTGGVSAWNGTTWTRLPQGPINRLSALLVHDGELFAAGGEYDKGRIARFDGQIWHLVGGDFDAGVDALGTYRGELIAGGSFRSYQGNACGYVARWDGSTWVSLGSGIDPSNYSGVSAIEEYGDQLIVGGWFTSCNYVPTPGLAAWDGTSWSALPGTPAAYVTDLMVMDGKLYVAGSFDGDYTSVAHWDGTTLTSDGLGQWVLGLASFGGRVTAVGGFYGAGCPVPKRLTGVAVLDGDGWNGLDRWEPSMHGLADNAGAADVASAVLYRGDLVVAGIFGLAGDGSEWQSISGPARWDGQRWQTVGASMVCPRIVEVVGDDLVAAGTYGIERWDGSQWHPMGSGVRGFPCAIAEYQGKVYVGGEIQIGATNQSTTLAVFDGEEWSEVPFAPNAAEWNTPRVSALEVKDGLLYVGGNFLGSQAISSPSVIAWNGQEWSPVGAGVLGEVLDLETFRGDLYVAGWIHHLGSISEGVMRWDGSTWTSLGLDQCQVLALGRYGDQLVIAGNAGVDRFVPGSLGIASWDGERWGGFGTGVNGQIHAIEQIDNALYVAGCFSYAGDQSSFSIARWGEANSSLRPPDNLPGRANALGVRSALVKSNRAQLSFSMPARGHARLELFDTRGARVTVLCDGVSVAGNNVVEWSPGSPAPFPPNGVYFLRLTADGKTANAKLVFAR